MKIARLRRQVNMGDRQHRIAYVKTTQAVFSDQTVLHNFRSLSTEIRMNTRGWPGSAPSPNPSPCAEERLFRPAEYLYGISRIPYQPKGLDSNVARGSGVPPGSCMNGWRAPQRRVTANLRSRRDGWLLQFSGNGCCPETSSG